MANKVLIMEDEEEIIDGSSGVSISADIVENAYVTISLPEGCKIEKNIVLIPTDEVLGIASNMLIQLDMLK